MKGVFKNLRIQRLAPVWHGGKGQEFPPSLLDIVLSVYMDLARFDVHHREAQLLHGFSYQPLLDLHQGRQDSVVYFLPPSPSEPVGLFVDFTIFIILKNQVSEFFEASVNGTAEPQSVDSDSFVGVGSEHQAVLFYLVGFL